jgi:hypothetical protein
LAAASLGVQCCTLSRVESPGMMFTARANLIPRKQHNKLTEFVARVIIAQWCQPFLSVCVRSTPLIDDVEERFLASIAENLRHCIKRCYCWSSRGALHHRQKQQGPTTTATSYVVSLSQARRRMKPGKGLVLKCRSTE